MGNIVNYRPTPRRIHTTEEGRSPYYQYGVSQITGWRFSQEDRYICLPKFHEDFSMFAVYDGHGGGHAAQYLYRFLHQHILEELIRHKDPELALYLGFVTTDLCLRNITKKELKVIEDDLELEFEVPDQEERRHFIMQFQNSSLNSPGTSKNDSSSASNAPGTSQGISQPDLVAQDLKAQIASACISELKSVKFLIQDEMEVDESDEEYDPDKDNIKLNYFGRNTSDEDGDDEEEDDDDDEESSESEESVDDDDLAKEPSGNEQAGDVDEDKKSSESKETVDDQNLAKNSSGNEEQSGKEEDREHDANTCAEKSKGCEEESKKIDNSVMEVSETPISGCSTEESPTKFVDFIKPESKEFCERSGSTATVLLLNDRKIYIANVGDSRCVACVGGQAVDLTVDHKPTKKEEKRRIYNAGGFLKDGRVSGILDMSRTFGDFEFKKKNVAEPFQMLTCEPFITSFEISDKLEFLIIASDGIWNSMDSQEVVDHVKNRMQDTHMELQDICGEMFELIIPTEATPDGTGCDNLTAILMVFEKQIGYSTPVPGLQECFTYNYSFYNREKKLHGRRSTSEQKSTSPGLHTEKLKNEGQCPSAPKDHCMPETDENYVPLEPIPIRSPSIHSDNEDSRHPPKKFKSYHSSIYSKQLDPRSSYYTHHDNSQVHPLNLVRHASEVCDEIYEPGHGEGSKYAEEPYVTDQFLNCFQDLRNFIEVTREKIKIVDNDLRAAINEMDVKLTGFLKHPEFAHHFGGHSYFNNLNNIQERTNNLFHLNPNVPSTFSNPNNLLNSEHFFKSFTGNDTQPLYVGMQPTYVETQSQRNKSASNKKIPQSASAEVLVVDLSSDEEEIHVGDNSGATLIVDEETSAVDNSGATEIVDEETSAVDNSGASQIIDEETSAVDNSGATKEVQVSQKSTEEEPLKEKDRMKIFSTPGELEEL